MLYEVSYWERKEFLFPFERERRRTLSPGLHWWAPELSRDINSLFVRLDLSVSLLAILVWGRRISISPHSYQYRNCLFFCFLIRKNSWRLKVPHPHAHDARGQMRVDKRSFSKSKYEIRTKSPFKDDLGLRHPSQGNSAMRIFIRGRDCLGYIMGLWYGLFDSWLIFKAVWES